MLATALVVGVVITVACGIKTPVELVDKLLEARSYYCEYRIEIASAERELLVKEWCQLPHQLYQEVYYQDQLLQQIWVNGERTCIKHADLEDHFIFGQQIKPVLLRVYEQVTAQDRLQEVEDGWKLKVKLSLGGRAEILCTDRGLPRQILEYTATDELLRRYTFFKFDLNAPFKQEQPPSL